MSDKRSVHTDALETLGTIIDENAKRDAIHVAVEPCIAADRLLPGQHVGIVDGKATRKAEKKLGIVDPFIEDIVMPGERFWLLIYPRTITSLRHVWSHPDFEENNIPKTAEPELTEKEKSQLWINNFADEIRQHPESLMNAADKWVETDDGGDYTYDNSESYKDHWDKFPEFWRHYEIVTGRKPKRNQSFFTCSC